MDVITRLARRFMEESSPEPAPTSLEETSRKATHRWKRLIMLMNLANNHAVTGSVWMALEAMHTRRVADSLQAYMNQSAHNGRAATAKLRVPLTPKAKSSGHPVAKGAPLEPSRGKFNWAVEVADCHHPPEELAERGNAYIKWLTCKGKGGAKQSGKNTDKGNMGNKRKGPQQRQKANKCRR